MTRYSIESRTIKYVKGNGFLSFARNLSKKYKKWLLNTGLDPLKTASKKVVHKAAESTVKMKLNKIADAISKSNGDKLCKEEILNELRRVW